MYHRNNSSNSLLFCILFCTAFLLPSSQTKVGKSGREKLQLKVHIKQEKLEPEKPIVYEGLPGEAEYEVDLSDQETDSDQEGESEVESFFSWIQKLSMGEDLAERVDDLICAWDKVVGTELETVVILLLGWLGFGGLIFGVSHFVYSSIGPGDTSFSSPATIPPFQGAEPVTTKTSQSLVIPPPSPAVHFQPTQSTVVGSNQDAVDFVNKCKEFIDSEITVRTDLVNSWLQKLNEFTIKSAVEDGFLVEFIEIIKEGTAEPVITNMTVETMPNDNLLVSGEVTASIAFLLRTSRPVRDEMVANDYVLNMDRIRGRFSITIITVEDLIIMKLEGWPDIKSRLSSAGPQSLGLTREEMNLAEVVEEVAVQAVRGVQMDIRPSLITNFPTFVKTSSNEPKQNQRKHSNTAFSMRKNTASTNGTTLQDSRQLEVKIVKAVQLGGSSGTCLEPYVVLEIDDPTQKMQSRTGSGSEYTWNDTFTIEITSQSSEVLFEVWDQGQKIGKSDAFMGLAIVSVSELMVTSSQRHVVPLQGRPYEEDQVTGLLTIEFLFKDGTTIIKQQAGNGTTRPLIQNDSLTLAGQAQTARKPSPISIPDLLTGATTVVKDEAIEEDKPSRTLLRPPRLSNIRPHSTPVDLRIDTSTNGIVNETDKEIQINDHTNITLDNPETNSISRGRRRTRTFFNSIKRKISGTRSLSSASNQEGVGPMRSVSDVRPNLTRTASSLSGRLQDDTSSMSGMSGISNASAITFVTEESSLVLETLENGIHHHYLVPIQVAKRGRFKKKGTKLHVYMDHIFVAQHMKLGSICSACKRAIPLRLGKQAYVCRDCGIITHKPCHVKVESHCLQTTLPSMELEYYTENVKT